MKKLFLLTAILFAFLAPFGARAEIVIGADDTIITNQPPLTIKEWRNEYISRGWSVPDIHGANNLIPVAARLDEWIGIFSLCDGSSPSVTASRGNMGAYIAGAGNIPTNRTDNPAAAYEVPVNGLQLDDWLKTGYKSHLGRTNFLSQTTSNENGHNLAFPRTVKFPVTAYWCEVISTSTNIGNASLNIATNSSTHQERPFNLNLPGVYIGANGIWEAFYDTTLGRWVQGGDDIVLISGQPITGSQYTYAIDIIGSRLSLPIALQGDVNRVKAEFAAAKQSVTVNLVKKVGGTNTVVATATASEAIPEIIETKTTNGMTLQLTGGQNNLLYGLQSVTNLPAASTNWVEEYPNQTYSSGGNPFLVPTTNGPRRFYRAIAKAP